MWRPDFSVGYVTGGSSPDRRREPQSIAAVFAAGVQALLAALCALRRALEHLAGRPWYEKRRGRQ